MEKQEIRLGGEPVTPPRGRGGMSPHHAPVTPARRADMTDREISAAALQSACTLMASQDNFALAVSHGNPYQTDVLEMLTERFAAYIRTGEWT